MDEINLNKLRYIMRELVRLENENNRITEEIGKIYMEAAKLLKEESN